MSLRDNPWDDLLFDLQSSLGKKKKKRPGEIELCCLFYHSYTSLASAAAPSRTLQTLTPEMNQKLCHACFPS